MNSFALYQSPFDTPVLVSKEVLISFPHRTANSTFSICLMSCTSSGSSDFSKSLMSNERLTESKALLISNSLRYIVKFFAEIAFSHKTFTANTCSVVLRPLRYAAWLGGISRSIRSIVRLFKHIASIFLNIESRMMGRR